MRICVAVDCVLNTFSEVDEILSFLEYVDLWTPGITAFVGVERWINKGEERNLFPNAF